MRKDGDTQHKLEEAAFFLGHLKPNYGKEKKFDFYLSAFISAARSVPLIMRAQYSRVEGWETWYAAEQAKADEPLKKGTTLARNRSLKSEPLRTLDEISLQGVHLKKDDTSFYDDKAEKLMRRIVDEGLPVTIGGSSTKYTIKAVIDQKPVTLYIRQAGIARSLKEFPGEHILDVCSRYYDWLAKLVADCEAKFGR